ncbi:uncharacterized protein LOC144715907 [Wolffia australiana]
MGCDRGYLLGLLVLLLSPSPFSALALLEDFSRVDFPPDFVFGAGTSAYQVEGAVDVDGKGLSIWDVFTHAGAAGKMLDGSTGDVTADGYHHYNEDVKLMSETGLEGYRFSISWSRLIPNGRGAVNPKGLEYYNGLIDELVKHGIEPHVTLYHLDLPQALEDEYNGWLSPKIVDDFVAFADLCFREFGDRVSHWTTVNEANILSVSAYDLGAFAPGRCSHPFGFFNCSAGDSTLEPYIVLHNILLSHAAVVKLYRSKYQAIQKGMIGMNVYVFSFSPRTNSTDDQEATARAIDFYIGWVLEPLLFGDYPKRMKETVGFKLPHFTKTQSKSLKGSIDFIAINYYASVYVSNAPFPKTRAQDYTGDMRALLSVSKDETPTAAFVPSSIPVDPIGLESFLLYLKERYGDLPIYIHENGFSTPYNVTVDDTGRTEALKTYIGGVLSSIRNGSTVRGYFVWSFLDVFEFLSGYKSRYGLYYVDFEDPDRPRKPKLSARWYRDFLKKDGKLMSGYRIGSSILNSTVIFKNEHANYPQKPVIFQPFVHLKTRGPQWRRNEDEILTRHHQIWGRNAISTATIIKVAQIFIANDVSVDFVGISFDKDRGIEVRFLLLHYCAAAMKMKQMGGEIANLLLILLFLSALISGDGLSRSDFPPDFIFGAGTSAFQVEGAVDEDGRDVSIWDTYTHAGGMRDGSTADVTADGYHHYKEDVKLMSEIGLESYRFSIAWPRIIPKGRGVINPKGIEFYNNFIDELVSHGIQPHVTLYHFDLPQVLEDEYGGWLSPKIVDDFAAFADVCFSEFGDRVSHWTTFNEPNILSIGAYDQGIIPPNRCSKPFGLYNCTAGDSTTEPYIVLHNFLLAHATVFDLYRTKYKAIQKGLVGINLYAFVFYPQTNNSADLEAAQRAYDFIFGWVLNPLLFGDYPKALKERARSRLPSLSDDQSRLLKGSVDYLGINYYSSMYVSDKSDTHGSHAQDFFGDMGVLLSASKNSTTHEKFDPTDLPADSDGLKRLLLDFTSKYGNIPIFVHENGVGTPYNVTTNDTKRIDGIKSSIGGVLSAIRRGSNCKGYFVWSFLDVFEFLTGFKIRFGLYYVDFEDKSRRRQPKLSALWYRDFLKKPVNLASF